MGNSSAPSTPLTRNWLHVSPSLIRNQLTNQLISQQTLQFDTLDQQVLNAQLLTKRIRLQHPHVLKLIYFASQNSPAACSPLERPYSTLVYTENYGDSLAEYAQVNPLPFRGKCPCLALLHGALYLQQYYGWFEVSSNAVFLAMEGNSQESQVRVWIHPSRAECQPQRVCSQGEMISSLMQVYGFIQGNEFCSHLKNNQIKLMRSCNSIEELQRDVVHFHLEQEAQSRHKKSRSAIEMEPQVLQLNLPCQKDEQGKKVERK